MMWLVQYFQYCSGWAADEFNSAQADVGDLSETDNIAIPDHFLIPISFKAHKHSRQSHDFPLCMSGFHPVR